MAKWQVSLAGQCTSAIELSFLLKSNAQPECRGFRMAQ